MAGGTDLAVNPDDERNIKVGDPDTIHVPRRNVKEQRRIYGGRYVKDSIDQRLAKEFAFHLERL